MASIPVLEFSAPVAQTHARMLAALSKNVTAGANDALLTRNMADFTLFAGLKVEAFSAAL